MRLQRAGTRDARVSSLIVAIVAALASVAIVPAAQSGAAAKPQPANGHRSFDELYAEGQRANAAMKTLTARFTETTTSSLLTRPLVAHGRLAVERPTRVVLRYTDPEARVVLIDGNKMTLSWPSRNIRQVTDISTAQRRVQKYFVNGTVEDLRRQFDIEQHDTSDRPNTYSVSLVPKRKQIREALVRLDLWVNQSSKLMDSMKMTFANGDTKTMTFEEVVANAPIEPGVFTLNR
jgi:outer membrane lipoprotein-sorting protein